MLLLVFVSQQYISFCCKQLLQLIELTEEGCIACNFSPVTLNSLSVGAILSGKLLAPQSVWRVSSALADGVKRVHQLTH